MKLTKKEGSNYTMTVVKLPKIQDVPGFDNLGMVTIFGNDCLVSKNSPESIWYLFIPAGTKLSPIFMHNNNLYTDPLLNKDHTKKGYIKDNGHVRAVKMKGVISTGLVMPAMALEYMDIDTSLLENNQSFDTVNGIQVCSKFESNVRTHNQSSSGNSNKDPSKKFDRLVPNQFRLHGDTAHLGRNTHVFDIDDVIVITNKLHGCCGIFSNVLVKKPLSFAERLLKKIGFSITDVMYDNVYSSRNVIKNRYINKDVTIGYYEEDVWGVVNESLKDKIEEGITLMGEIVGYTPKGQAIQKGYGYGCKSGENKFYVFRITYTKPSGDVIEFTWQMIKEYCKKYELLHVPAYFHGSLNEFFLTYDIEADRPDWADRWYNHLTISYNMEKPCELCLNNVPAEGLVVRRDGLNNFSSFKLKSKSFTLKENEMIEKGEEENLE